MNVKGMSLSMDKLTAKQLKEIVAHNKALSKQLIIMASATNKGRHCHNKDWNEIWNNGI